MITTTTTTIIVIIIIIINVFTEMPKNDGTYIYTMMQLQYL